MRFELVHEQLTRLPSPLPPGRPELEPLILGPEALPGSERRATDGPPREAAALVLIYPDATGEAHVVLMVRPEDDHVHAGQVALPGGKREAGDDFPVGTALREAAEEVGLDAREAGVTVVGRLDTVDVRVSGFRMVPVLAVAQRQPALVAEPREVSRVLTVSVDHFLPGAVVEQIEEERDGWRMRYAAYPVEGFHVWGATARVMGQLGALLGRSRPDP